MHVRHWNATRRDQRMTGVKRYEDELYDALQAAASGEDREALPEGEPWRFSRRRPHPNKLLGSTFASWLGTYRTGGADLVHATDETVAPAALLRRPEHLVVTSHGLIPLRYPSTIEDRTTRLIWRLVPRALRRADRIVAISEFAKRETVDLAGVDPERVDVVHHGIDHERYQPLDREYCRAALSHGVGLDLDPDLRYVLVVASTLEQKRMDLVRGAFERLRETHPDVRLLKAGYAEDLEGEGIVNTGWVPEGDLPKLYSVADIYFHPSEYESFGFPVLEAMACGVPVVTSDRTSIPEVLGDAGRTADPGDVDAARNFASLLADGLVADVSDEGAVARSREFTWERTALEMLSVYRRVLP